MIRTVAQTPNTRIKTANAWLEANPFSCVKNERGSVVTLRLEKGLRTQNSDWMDRLKGGPEKIKLDVTSNIADSPVRLFDFINRQGAGLQGAQWTVARKFDLLHTLSTPEWYPVEGYSLIQLANMWLVSSENRMRSPQDKSNIYEIMLRTEMPKTAPMVSSRPLRAVGIARTILTYNYLIEPLAVKTPTGLVSMITAFANEHDLGSMWTDKHRFGLLMQLMKDAQGK